MRRVASRRVASCRVASCRLASCRVVSCRLVWDRVVSCRVSCRSSQVVVVWNRVVSCRVVRVELYRLKSRPLHSLPLPTPLPPQTKMLVFFFELFVLLIILCKFLANRSY